MKFNCEIVLFTPFPVTEINQSQTSPGPAEHLIHEENESVWSVKYSLQTWNKSYYWEISFLSNLIVRIKYAQSFDSNDVFVSFVFCVSFGSCWIARI